MSTPTRFSDGQYKNWLKCSLSLIIMKEALHDYVDNEVKKLHGDITLKVSSIPCGSSTGNQCGCCSSKNIKLTGGKHGNWYINCKKSICDKWLHEILAVHGDPQNPTINWKNADISQWPTDCYQVVKIFMPKGQDKTTKMPDDLDAPAILSLLKYCNWFRKDLPNTQILSDLIDIRNKVLHSGDMRVADVDKDSWIDLMIWLLSDLKIHGNALAKLQMLKKEDIDITFRENEIRILQKMVSGLVTDLTAVKGDMASLQNSQSEEMEQLRDKTTETNGKMDTMEADIERIRKSLEELKIIYDKMVSFFDKNPGIVDKEITETIRNIGIDVQDQQSNLLRVETELKARVSSLEKHLVETKQEIEETKKNLEETKKHVEGIEKRVAAVEEQETTRKIKRPESDGLKQLKYQTEDKLDTLRRLKCIQTKQAEEAKKLLEGKRSVVIKGKPGEGKTTMALHLIDNEMYRDKRVMLYCAQDWKTVDTYHVDIVVLEDVFGQYDFDRGRLQEWMVYLPTIQEHVDAGKLKVIVITRVDILSKAYSRLGSLKLFSDDLSLTVSSEQLKNSEKLSILNRELHRYNRNMNEDEKEKCIANFSGSFGFPQCCSLFAGDSKSFNRGPEFFRSPEKFFLANIIELEATRFLSLAFLFCNHTICVENLSSETMLESSKHLLMELAFALHISEKEASITLLRNAYDSFLELYVVKSMSHIFILGSAVEKPYIRFTHATVCEAVGQVLGDRCLEMVVKYGDSEYLYQKTYTAEAKDSTSQKVFIPVSLYGLLAQRMVDDIINRGLAKSVVKHAALKHHDYLMKLKCELQKGNVMKDFFMAVSESVSEFLLESGEVNHDLTVGKCMTFMQCILQSDEDVVRLVYSQFLEFLACAHNNNSFNCWQCEEKQKLLELAIYYNHFQIADKLITMKACYTHESLCNAARHGDLRRVQTILENLKCQGFNPECKEAKYALCRAYISGKQNLIELLLKEGIILDSCHVILAAQHGDIIVLMNVVEHLKCHNKWNPHMEQNKSHGKYFKHSIYFVNIQQWFQSEIPYFTALYRTYCNEKFDMADYLLKNEVKVLMNMLVSVSKYSSQQAVVRVIKDLKDAGTWDCHSDHASEALSYAYRFNKYDVCDLLVQEGVSLIMKNVSDMVCHASLEYVKKSIQHLKDTVNWDPKCDYASKALEEAYTAQKYDVCDLLVQEGVSLSMKNFPGVVQCVSLEYVKKAIQHLKDTVNWDPECDYASEALSFAYIFNKYDVCDLLIQEGVSLTMKNFPDFTLVLGISLQSVKKVIQHFKDTVSWDPKCHYASEALEEAYRAQKYDVCDLLVQEGVSLTMKNVSDMVCHASLEYVKKSIQHLKDTVNWDPKCDYASEALKEAYTAQKYDVCDLLVQEGVSLTMKNFPHMVCHASLESAKKAIQHLKDTVNWDPKCDYASEALSFAYIFNKYDVCDLLVQEGVSLTMKNFPHMVCHASLESAKKAIQHLKDTVNWDPKCDYASEALKEAYTAQKYDVCDLLVQEGVSLTMKNFPHMVCHASLESAKKAIQHLKDTVNWDPKCEYASEALSFAYIFNKYDVCDLLIQEGVSLTMKNFPDFTLVLGISLQSVKKVIQHFKDTVSWDPKCHYASEALEEAYRAQKYDVCDLLVQEGVSLTMKIVSDMVCHASLEYVKKSIQHLKDTVNWDPKCDYASKALEEAYTAQKYDVCDLLVQEGVSLSMKNFPGVVQCVSLEYVKKAIQHLKDTVNWDPKCDYASEALSFAYIFNKYDVCDLLIQEGVSLTMKNFPDFTLVLGISLQSVKKVIQHFKDTVSWDPKCHYASEALEKAYRAQKYDVCDLLVQEGVSLTMKNVSDMVCHASLEYVKKSIQHLKDTVNWDPKCDYASKALEEAYTAQKYDVCDLLVQEGVSLSMKNFPGVVQCVSLEYVKKAIQHLKDTVNWDPKCDYVSEALKDAYRAQKYDVCDLLVQEGVC